MVTEMHEEFAALYAWVTNIYIYILVVLTDPYRYIFRNVDPETGWAVRATALNTSARLRKDIESHLSIPDTGETVSLFNYKDDHCTHRIEVDQISQKLCHGSTCVVHTNS